MGLNNNFSDYGSGSGSSEKFSLWGSSDTWSAFQTRLQEAELPSRTRSSSFIEGTTKGLDAVMQEFRMNGSDSPYEPEEDVLSNRRGLTGMGPSSAYLRQKSWPAPDSSPAVRLPRAQPWPPAAAGATDVTSTRLTEVPTVPESHVAQEVITEQQMRVLRSLPNAVLYPLLRELEQSRQTARGWKQEEVECRFCKNNGERPAYYRSHALRAGGRVACPVLRAFVCRRCGARGDAAHTLKYCPLTTAEERTKSAAMMRSLRMTSGRRRQAPSSDTQEYVMFGDRTPSVIADGNMYNKYESLPLDPIWAALEQKLML
ncbi:uncharacterized protein [Epargyreus clarus]|uniref:uncharacterized protein n=1 Tax=Epargyreus clarus TaxID=520877 RepID=UPI003C2E3708